MSGVLEFEDEFGDLLWFDGFDAVNDVIAVGMTEHDSSGECCARFDLTREQAQRLLEHLEFEL